MGDTSDDEDGTKGRGTAARRTINGISGVPIKRKGELDAGECGVQLNCAKAHPRDYQKSERKGYNERYGMDPSGEGTENLSREFGEGQKNDTWSTTTC